MTNIYSEAAYLNNKGVVALLQGDMVRAIHFFPRAIKILKAALAAEEPPFHQRLSSPHNSIASSGTAQTIEIMELGAESLDNAIAFQQAIWFPPLMDTRIGLEIYAAAVIFNLALSNHCLASLTKSSDASSNLSKAERLYEITLNVLMDDVYIMSTAPEVALTVVLACINNLIMIHQHCSYKGGGHAGSGTSDSQLLPFLTALSGLFRHRGSSERYDALFEIPEIQALLINAMFLLSNDNSQAKLAPAA